jgi:hypothetical protein
MLQQLCIHHGATSIAEGNTMVSNALKAKDEPVVFPISPDALNDERAIFERSPSI